jgi:hypothetical protein
MDHVDIVLESDADDVVLSKIGTNRSAALSNDVCLVRLRRSQVKGSMRDRSFCQEELVRSTL